MDSFQNLTKAEQEKVLRDRYAHARVAMWPKSPILSNMALFGTGVTCVDSEGRETEVDPRTFYRTNNADL